MRDPYGLKQAIQNARLTQTEVATHMGYRDDLFSKVLGGGLPPKQRQSPKAFKAAVLTTIRELKRT